MLKPLFIRYLNFFIIKLNLKKQINQLNEKYIVYLFALVVIKI